MNRRMGAPPRMQQARVHTCTSATNFFVSLRSSRVSLIETGNYQTLPGSFNTQNSLSFIVIILGHAHLLPYMNTLALQSSEKITRLNGRTFRDSSKRSPSR